MSAFVVRRETMDRFLTAYRSVESEGYPENFTDERLTEIGQKLFRLNVQAVNYKYDERRRVPSYVFKVSDGFLPSHTVVGPSQRAFLVAGFKAGQCIQYQCYEGRFPNTKMFEELSLIISCIADAIICKFPEYDSAPWD